MSRMIKISEALSLALHGMVYIASRPGEILTVDQVARVLRASSAHLHKVFQRLSNVGLLKSCRGPKGGYALAKPSDAISLLEIYEAIEGPLSIDNCLFDHPICQGPTCIFGDLLETTHKRYQAYLEGMRLSELKDVYQRDDQS